MTSRLALGTAAFGPYAGQPALSDFDARDLIDHALRAGVRRFDTSPGYGRAEAILGQAIRGRHEGVLIATKIDVGHQAPIDLAHLRDRVLLSLDTSVRLLGAPAFAAQVHSFDPTAPAHTAALELLCGELRDAGLFTAPGASVYSPDEANVAMTWGAEFVQLPFNLLDQRARGFLRRCEWPVWARSPWLRGALSGRDAPEAVRWHASRLALLVRKERRAAFALRFALTYAPYVIVGVRTIAELDAALAAEREGPLSWWERRLARWCASDDRRVYDPRTWDEERRLMKERVVTGVDV